MNIKTILITFLLIQNGLLFGQSLKKSLLHNSIDLNNKNGINIICESLSSKKIIAFAESTHGTKEFSLIRYNIIKNLIEDHRTQFIGFEEDFGDMYHFNQYINTANVNLKKLVPLLGLPYKNKEFLDFIEWLKRYNSLKKEHKVSIFGYDMQFNQQSSKAILDILKSSKKIHYSTYENTLTALSKNHYTNYRKVIDQEAINKLLNDLKSLKKDIEYAKNEIPKKDWLSLSLGINVLIQKVECKSLEEQDMKRDFYMAKNIQIFMTEINQSPMAIISHSRHAQKIPTQFFTTLGTYLNKEYESNYFVIGFEFGSGSVRAMKKKENSLGIFNIKRTSDSFSVVMNKSSSKQYYLDLSVLPGNSVLNKNINKVHTLKDIGGNVFKFPLRYNPTEIYDAVIFIKEGNATEEIKK